MNCKHCTKEGDCNLDGYPCFFEDIEDCPESEEAETKEDWDDFRYHLNKEET